jgi:hypothetical protein
MISNARQVRLNATLTRSGVRPGNNLSIGLVFSSDGKAARADWGKLIEVNYSCVTVLCLRKNDPIVQQVHTAKCTCVTQTVTVFVGRERRERVSHHNWSGDASLNLRRRVNFTVARHW